MRSFTCRRSRSDSFCDDQPRLISGTPRESRLASGTRADASWHFSLSHGRPDFVDSPPQNGQRLTNNSAPDEPLALQGYQTCRRRPPLSEVSQRSYKQGCAQNPTLHLGHCQRHRMRGTSRRFLQAPKEVAPSQAQPQLTVHVQHSHLRPRHTQTSPVKFLQTAILFSFRDRLSARASPKSLPRVWSCSLSSPQSEHSA